MRGLLVLVPVVCHHPTGRGWLGHGLHAEGVDALHVGGLQHRGMQHLREVKHEKRWMHRDWVNE